MLQTPAALGYRMPAEWEPHAATWIAWPHNREDWPGKFSPIRWVYTEIVRHLSRVEHVRHRRSQRHDEAARGRPARRRRRRPRLRSFFKAATDRSWLRDTGPTFRRERCARLRFGRRPSAWSTGSSTAGPSTTTMSATTVSRARSPVGSSCPDGFRGSMTRIAGMRRVVMEGGAIDVNGRGTLLATEECLLERGPGPQPRARSHRARDRSSPTISRSATSSGSAGESRATTPTATSTTSRGSSGRTSSRPSSSHDADDPNHEAARRQPAPPAPCP